jgi:RimJ/RimL family protein N-acetyltransferase
MQKEILPGKKLLNDFSIQKISGKKINLRVLEKNDLEKSLMWLKDTSINMYLSSNFRDYDREKELKWFEFIQNSNNDVVFAIEEKVSGLHIGNCSLDKINWERESCEMGIVIGDKNNWNKGFGSEAVKTITEFAFRKLGLQSVQLNVYKYNRRAIRVYRKCGFKLKGIEKRNHFYNGKYWDTLIMELKSS